MWARSRGGVLFAVIALGAPLMVIRSAGADGTEPDFVAVNERGTPLFSLSDGTLKGSALDSYTCGTGPPPCLVFDVKTVLRYPDGEVTLRDEIPVAPDPGRPGFFLFGTRPSSSHIVSSTGVYAGRTGWLAVSGSLDMRRCPDPMPFEGIGMLVLAD
jgi:hypothetical protein